MSALKQNAVGRTQLETINEQQYKERIAWIARDGIFDKRSAVDSIKLLKVLIFCLRYEIISFGHNSLYEHT